MGSQIYSVETQILIEMDQNIYRIEEQMAVHLFMLHL
jgi:hypothetical protein